MAHPRHRFQFENSTEFRQLVISSKPNAMLRNPVDFDVWLTFPCMKTEHEVLTHEDVIESVGNTLGAHLDPHVLPSVLFLRSTKMQNFELQADFLTAYLLQIARVVHSLGLSVLKHVGLTSHDLTTT